MVELTIYNLLAASSSVAAIAGSRIYPLTLPTDVAMPALDYKIISCTSEPTFAGSGSQKFRIEINCWGDSYKDAITLRSAVIRTLSGYYLGTTSIQFAMSQDIFDDELLQYRAICEFYAFTTGF